MVDREPRTRKARCLEDLRRRILTLDLAPGEHLDETRLSAVYEVSRPPLREVLYQLSGEEYVVLRENRGAQVAPMTHKTLRNFFLAAPMLYAAVARLAAENATSGQLERLREAQRDFRRAISDGAVAETALTNQRFHAIIGEMADNEYLLPSLQRLMIDHTRISMTFYNPRHQALADRRIAAADHHDRFIALIEAGDADAAAALAVDHWELSREEFERFVTPRGMRIPLGDVPSAMNGKEEA